MKHSMFIMHIIMLFLKCTFFLILHLTLTPVDFSICDHYSSKKEKLWAMMDESDKLQASKLNCSCYKTVSVVVVPHN